MRIDGINKLLIGTLVLSGLTNLSLLSDLSKENKKTDYAVNKLNRAHLIATYYVLKEDPTKQIKNYKEEIKMEKNGAIISNRTKVIGGVTFLLGVATIISTVKDIREVKRIESGDIIDPVIDAATNGIDSIADATEEAASTIEF